MAEDESSSPILPNGLKLIITGRMNRTQLIAKVAYHKAEDRGFEPGHDWEDWFKAEEEIEKLLDGSPKGPVTISFNKEEEND